MKLGLGSGLLLTLAGLGLRGIEPGLQTPADGPESGPVEDSFLAATLK